VIQLFPFLDLKTHKRLKLLFKFLNYYNLKLNYIFGWKMIWSWRNAKIIGTPERKTMEFFLLKKPGHSLANGIHSKKL